jgi:hypothetical protein
MLKKHIVLLETKDYDWIAYSITITEAKKLLNINKNCNEVFCKLQTPSDSLYGSGVFYIFKCNILQQYPYTMKLKAPLNKYYDCKNIIKYKEEIFKENDEYIIVSYESDEINLFDIKYNKQLELSGIP